MIKNDKKKLYVYLPIILSVILISGLLIGHYVLPTPESTSFTISPRSGKINQVFRYIQMQYVDSVVRSDLEESVIPKILEELDPHSNYIPAEDLQKVSEPLEGGFSGIGIQFNMQNDTVAVIATIANGPSEKVGILAGDRIVKVNDSTVAGVGLSSDYIVSQLKGKRGTKVKVSISRRGEEDLLDFVITRDNIPLYSVDIKYMLNQETGYIKINKFSRTTYNEFKQAVNFLKRKDMKMMVLDLRGNSGGYLDAATNIADEFLEKGKLMVYTEGRMQPRVDYPSSPGGLCVDIPVVVLMDEFSASASEILAGAIQDNDRGQIVGRRSFGKGLVQQNFFFSDGSAMRLTVARYYTPTGRSIQKPYQNGIEDYYSDLQNRYEHGEFMVEDSIQFPDSLKYITPKGKIVYGGGGIMPDVFVPMDTVGSSDYLLSVRNKGLIYKFAFKYADENRSALTPIKTYQEMEEYLDGQNVMTDFTNYAVTKGVKKDLEGIRASETVLKTQLNAYIIRNILDNEGFFPVIHKIDNTLNKAIEILEKND